MRDIDIRKVLLKAFQNQYKKNKDTLIIPELGLCQGGARIDIAVVNGLIHGYEIKSERDTLIRLPAQQDIYNRVLNRVTMVASTCHIPEIKTTVPKWWGIVEAKYDNKKLKINDLRGCKDNNTLDPSALVQLLWRDEAFAILKSHNLHRGLSNKARDFLWDALIDFLSVNELQNEIRLKIKARQYWRSARLQTLGDG